MLFSCDPCTSLYDARVLLKMGQDMKDKEVPRNVQVAGQQLLDVKHRNTPAFATGLCKPQLISWCFTGSGGADP